MMISIRGGNGLGDALYVQAVTRHLIKQGNRVLVCVRKEWRDVFKPLHPNVAFDDFRRIPIDRVAHYTKRKEVRGTSQFEDCCIQAGITEPVEFRLDWEPTRFHYIHMVRASGLPVVLVALPRQPMDRKDGYGSELMPHPAVMQAAVDALRGKAFLVQVGHGKPLYHLDGINLDLTNKTTICDLLDLAWAADGLLGYCSFFVPLAESLEKPLLCVWATAGLRSMTRFIRLVTPQKILHRETSRFVLDNCSDEQLKAAIDEFCFSMRCSEVHRRQDSGDCRERSIFA